MKYKMQVLSVLFVLRSCQGNAETYFSPLSTQDWVMQGIFVGLTFIDWTQTKKFREEGRKETNPWLGEEPSQEKVDTYIFGGMVLHSLITFALPKKARPFWQGFTILLETVAVTDNAKYGFKVSVNF